VARNRNHDTAGNAIVTLADIERELHRLRESKMLLVLTAEGLGVAIPRSCCPHPGQSPCASCSSDWLVAHVPPYASRPKTLCRARMQDNP
jgi:hypothetical protein